MASGTPNQRPYGLRQGMSELEREHRDAMNAITIRFDGTPEDDENCGLRNGWLDVRLKNRVLTQVQCGQLYNLHYAKGYFAGAKLARQQKRQEAVADGAKVIPSWLLAKMKAGQFDCMKSYSF